MRLVEAPLLSASPSLVVVVSGADLRQHWFQSLEHAGAALVLLLKGCDVSIFHTPIIRGESERAPNTRGTGSGFICIYVSIWYVCLHLWGDHFSEKRDKLNSAHAHYTLMMRAQLLLLKTENKP